MSEQTKQALKLRKSFGTVSTDIFQLKEVMPEY